MSGSPNSWWVGVVICLAAIALALFGVWGSETEAGRRHYDEMAGMIPGFALLGSPVVLLIGVIILFISRKRD